MYNGQKWDRKASDMNLIQKGIIWLSHKIIHYIPNKLVGESVVNWMRIFSFLTEMSLFSETDLNCHVDLTGTLETYTDGQSWKPDKCVKCTCKRGLTFCKQQSCHNITICPYMESTEGDCCPVCKGLYRSGKPISSS